MVLLYFRFRRLRTFSNLFVLNLTVADFLLCIGNIPMFIIASFSGHWLFEVIGTYLNRNTISIKDLLGPMDCGRMLICKI